MIATMSDLGDLGKIVAISNKGKSENQMTVASVEARAVLG
jgi:hypothetical protein